MSASTCQYDDEFYQQQVSGSYQSAKVVAPLLGEIFIPDSAVDVGCGRGTWLKAFKEIGTRQLVGFDGEWNAQENMIEDSIVFNACNLNKGICGDDYDRFDLAISLEVAEHLEPSSSERFVQSLVRLSDAVLFSAAFTGQLGRSHINCRRHTYWGQLFAVHDYIPFDVFRPLIWGDARVEFWYRRNTFLYVRKNSDRYAFVRAKKIAPMADIAFMDCINPALYLGRLPLRQSVRLIPRALSTIQRRLFRRARRSNACNE